MLFSVGDATIVRVEETNLPTYPLREIFPEFTDAHLGEHGAWLAPHHYEAESGRIKLAVHSWLLQVGGKKILIDSCCGNNKVKPGRPFWNMLNLPYLERLAAAGVRPEDIDLEVLGTRMTLRGVRRDVTAKEECRCFQMEIAYSHFERSLTLPCDLGRARVRAEHRHGMLLVYIDTEADR